MKSTGWVTHKGWRYIRNEALGVLDSVSHVCKDNLPPVPAKLIDTHWICSDCGEKRMGDEAKLYDGVVYLNMTVNGTRLGER